MKIIVKFQYSVIVEYFLFAACRHSYCGSVREEIEDLVAYIELVLCHIFNLLRWILGIIILWK